MLHGVSSNYCTTSKFILLTLYTAILINSNLMTSYEASLHGMDKHYLVYLEPICNFMKLRENNVAMEISTNLFPIYVQTFELPKFDNCLTV